MLPIESASSRNIPNNFATEKRVALYRSWQDAHFTVTTDDPNIFYTEHLFLVDIAGANIPVVQIVGFLKISNHFGFSELTIPVGERCILKNDLWILSVNRHQLHLPYPSPQTGISEQQLLQSYLRLGLPYRQNQGGFYCSANGFGNISELAIFPMTSFEETLVYDNTLSDTQIGLVSFDPTPHAIDFASNIGQSYNLNVTPLPVQQLNTGSLKDFYIHLARNA